MSGKNVQFLFPSLGVFIMLSNVHPVLEKYFKNL